MLPPYGKNLDNLKRVERENMKKDDYERNAKGEPVKRRSRVTGERTHTRQLRAARKSGERRRINMQLQTAARDPYHEVIVSDRPPLLCLSAA